MPIATLSTGVDLFYDERGEGEPLVLVMGIGAQLIYWPDGLVDSLVARGFRVIRFDHRDIGLSSRLDHLGVPPLLPTIFSGRVSPSRSLMLTVSPFFTRCMADS